MQISTSFYRSASLAVLTTLGSFGLAQAQTAPPAWSWANAVTSPAATFLSGMTTDAAGNTYITGGLPQASPVTLAPGTVLTSQALADAYVAKYSASGSLLWTHQLTGSGNERIDRFVTDAAGNVYLTGSFSGSIQLGSLSLKPSNGVSAVFMASLDAQGQPRWLREVSRNGLGIQNIGVDAAGNLYLSGTFSGNITSVTVGGIPLSAPGTLSIFLAKFDAQGVAQWAQHGGGIPYSGSVSYFGHTLTISPAGDTYLTWTIHPAAGGFGAVPPATSYGDDDVTVVRYNTQGVVQWQKRYGTPSTDNAGSTALDGNGHLLVPMTLSSTGPATIGAQTLTGTGLRYGALLQLDAGTGSLQWVRQLEATTSVNLRAVAADAAGNSYVAGSLIGTIQAGSQQLSSNGGSSDALVVSYSAQGTPRWFQKSNSAQSESANLIALSANNELSVAGSFNQQAQFGSTMLTGTATATIPSIFIAHIASLPTPTQAARPLALGLYPNPATGWVHVPALNPGLPVQLIDALGRVARTTTVSAAAQVSVQGLRPGLYTLRATDAQGRQLAGKVVVE